MLSEETNLTYLLTTPGSLPFLPAAGESDPAPSAGQHDAPGHHHAHPEAPKRLGPGQEHEERAQRHQGLPRQNSQVLNTETIVIVMFNSHFPVFGYEEGREVPGPLDAHVEEGVGGGVAQLDLHLRGLQAHRGQAQEAQVAACKCMRKQK